MARIRADDQDPSLATDYLALLAHWLDRGSYLHARFALFGDPMVPDRALAAAEAAATQTGCARRQKRTPATQTGNVSRGVRARTCARPPAGTCAGRGRGACAPAKMIIFGRSVTA